MIAFLLLLTAATPQDTAPNPCASRAAGVVPVAFVAIGARQPRDTTLTATVCVVPARGASKRIASYHGELHFDSSAARVLRVDKAGGGVRVENGTLKSQVNFAGAAPDGFSGRALVTVILRLRGATSAPALRLVIKELNGTDGTALLKQLVVEGAPR